MCWCERVAAFVKRISLIFFAVFGRLLYAVISSWKCFLVSIAAASPKNPSTTALIGVEGRFAVPNLVSSLKGCCISSYLRYTGSLRRAFTTCLKLYCLSLVVALFLIASLLSSLKSLSFYKFFDCWWGVQFVRSWATPSLSGIGAYP